MCSLEELAGALVIAAGGAGARAVAFVFRHEPLLLEPTILRGRCCSYIHFAGEELHAPEWFNNLPEATQPEAQTFH